MTHTCIKVRDTPSKTRDSAEKNLTNEFIGFPSGSEGKASAHNAGDLGLIPGSGRSPGEENGNPLQYSCLGNPMGREAWQAAVCGVMKELDTI